jgi:hypothetical protein
LGAYDHTPVLPLVKAVLVTGPITVLPFTSTLMDEPFARKPSVYHGITQKEADCPLPNTIADWPQKSAVPVARQPGRVFHQGSAPFHHYPLPGWQPAKR